MTIYHMTHAGTETPKFNKEASQWLGVWMDTHLTFKRLHEKGQGCRSETPNTYQDVWSRSSKRLFVCNHIAFGRLRPWHNPNPKHFHSFSQSNPPAFPASKSYFLISFPPGASKRESRPNSLRPSRRIVWKRALVASKRKWQTRRPPASNHLRTNALSFATTAGLYLPILYRPYRH
jgi:hypothetical protein